jgi:hypothetical protein
VNSARLRVPARTIVAPPGTNHRTVSSASRMRIGVMGDAGSYDFVWGAPHRPSSTKRDINRVVYDKRPNPPA